VSITKSKDHFRRHPINAKLMDADGEYVLISNEHSCITTNATHICANKSGSQLAYTKMGLLCTRG
jgi:hypothetical protein